MSQNPRLTLPLSFVADLQGASMLEAIEMWAEVEELFTRFTSIPVREATNHEPVRPDHIYLLPPGKEIEIATQDAAAAGRAVLDTIEADSRPA